MQPTFCLAIPHTPWIPERVASMRRLKLALATAAGDEASSEGLYREFTDREPNKVWAQKLWRWAASTGATHLVQLQDDVLPAPNFWAVLTAMVTANPDHFIGLEANHPLCREQARLGKRWIKTRAWVVGVGYVFPLTGPDSIHEFLAWGDANPDTVASSNEDDLIGKWISKTRRDCWHPIPTIIDHDISIPSVYGNDHHDHRRPVVTWHGYQPAELEAVEFWTPPAVVPILPVQHGALCIFCQERKPDWTHPVTLAGLCAVCHLAMYAAKLGLNLSIGARPVGTP